MSGFCIENEGVERRLVYRLEAEEFIDSFGYGMVIDNEIEGLLPVITSGRNGIEEIRYDLQSMISLRSYLESSMSRRRLLELFRGIIEVIRSISMYLLDSSMLVFDMDSIFLVGSPLRVAMVYLPVIRRDMQCDVNEIVRNLFRTVIISARFVVEDDNSYITELLNALNSEQDYSIPNMYTLLERLSLDVRKRYTDENLQYEDNQHVNNQYVNNVSADVISFPGNNNPDIEYAEEFPDDSTQEGDCNKGILHRFTGVFKGMFGRERMRSYSNNSELIINFPDEKNGTCEPDYYSLESEPSYVCEDNSFTQDTVLLRRTPRDNNIPYLSRVSNNEMIGIDKQLFRIGKDERYADYRITDNAAISRAHAEISVKNGVCYLTDEDSLNHTYVNGKELDGHIPEELKSGDVIRFADEEYIFHC